MARSISTRISLTAISLTMAVVTALGIASYIFTSKTLHNRAQEELSFQARLTGTKIETLLKSVANDVQNMSGNLVVVNALLDSMGRETYVEPFLQSYRLPKNTPCRITLADFNGNPMVSCTGRKTLKAYNDETLLSVVITNQQPFARMEMTNGEPTILIAAPVFYSATGQAEGFLAMEFPLLAMVVSEFPTPSDSSPRTYSLSRSNTILWTSPTLTDASPLTATLDLVLPPPLDQLGLRLTISQDITGMNESLHSLTESHITIGILTLFLVIIVAQYQSRQITGPLRALTTLANQIARDDAPETPAPPPSNDEILQLATAFDTMLDRLRESRQTLEDRVKERTSELASTTQILKAILDNAPIGITRVVNRKQVWMNNTAEKMFQYSKEEMAHQSTSRLYPSIAAFEALGREAYPVLAQGQVYETEQELVRKDGTHILVRLIGSAVTEEDINQGAIWLLEDISDRKEAERLLKESEERFRTVANYTYAWEIWESPQGQYLYCSPSCERITGHSAQEFMDDPGLLERLIHPDDIWKWKAHHTRVHNKTEPQHTPEGHLAEEIDFRIVLPGGAVRWISHVCYGIRNREGKNLGRRISNRDISDRKKTEEALLRSEKLLKRAQAVAEIGSWRLDIPANHLEWSEETYHLFGIPTGKEIDVDSFLKAIHPDDRSTLLDAWEDALAGAPYDIAHRIVRGEEILWVQERAEIERDLDGRPLVGVGTVQNITSSKIAEEKLRIYAEMQAVLLREVNHRVKNNLIAIISMLHQEEDRAREKGWMEYQRRIQEIVWRISGLLTVHRLLSSSAWQPLLLDQLCINVIKETLKAVSASRRIQLTIPPSQILVDSDQAHSLAMIVNELSTNTLKYGLAGRDSATITVSLHQQGNVIELIYHDDGPGFPAAAQRAPLPDSGIGMTLIRGLVTRNLAGTIFLSNNHGAETRITFPANTEIQGTIHMEDQT